MCFPTRPLPPRNVATFFTTAARRAEEDPHSPSIVALSQSPLMQKLVNNPDAMDAFQAFLKVVIDEGAFPFSPFLYHLEKPCTGQKSDVSLFHLNRPECSQQKTFLDGAHKARGKPTDNASCEEVSSRMCKCGYTYNERGGVISPPRKMLELTWPPFRMHSSC